MSTNGYSREALQAAFVEATAEKLRTLVVPADKRHVIRMVKALIRMAASKALGIGMPLDVFCGTAVDCYLKESGSELDSSQFNGRTRSIIKA